MAPRTKVREQKLQKLDVVVSTGPATSEVHLASPEALQWVERNVALDQRVIVTALTWSNALAAEITEAMERDGLVVTKQADSGGVRGSVWDVRSWMSPRSAWRQFVGYRSAKLLAGSVSRLPRRIGGCLGIPPRFPPSEPAECRLNWDLRPGGLAFHLTGES